MFSGLSDQFMVMRAALAPVRLTKWQIVRLVAKQVYRQLSFIQFFFILSNTLSLLYTVYIVFYRLFFHPLAQYPGPKLAAISEFWYIYHCLAGRYPWDVEELHRKYGPIVRIAPNELSFASSHSATEIYGQAKKSTKRFSRVENGSLDGDDIRKALPQIFGGKTFKNSKEVIYSNADAFISRLSSQDTAVDISAWYQWLTFDIMGELMVGSSFNAVKQGLPHLWLGILENSSFYGGISSIILRLLPRPFANLLLDWLPFKGGILSFQAYLREKLHQQSSRLKNTTGRPSFSTIVSEKDPTISPDALSSHANAIIQAGSLNMSTFLTTTTYYLLSDPSILEKATEEVRSTFTELNQIDNESLQLLTNLPAVIEEGLRLFPPTPFGASSRSHGATTVAGNFIPHGTIVSSCTRAITHNPLNFSSASAFLPQRWLPAHHPAYEKRFATDTLSASKPFGLGPQACPGIEIAYLEARVILAKVLWAFDLEVDGEMEGWEDRVRWRGGWRLPNVMVRLVPVVREEGSEVLV